MQAQARVVSALPDAAQLFAGVRGVDADCCPVGRVCRRRGKYPRRCAVAGPVSGLHTCDVLLGAGALRNWHSTLRPLVSPDPEIARYDPICAARSAAAVLLEFYWFRRHVLVLQRHDALGKDGAMTVRPEATMRRTTTYLLSNFRFSMGWSEIR